MERKQGEECHPRLYFTSHKLCSPLPLIFCVCKILDIWMSEKIKNDSIKNCSPWDTSTPTQRQPSCYYGFVDGPKIQRKYSVLNLCFQKKKKKQKQKEEKRMVDRNDFNEAYLHIRKKSQLFDSFLGWKWWEAYKPVICILAVFIFHFCSLVTQIHINQY